MTKWKASFLIPIRFLFDSYSTPFMHLGVRFPTDRNHSHGLCFRFYGSIPNPPRKPSAAYTITAAHTIGQRPTKRALACGLFKANFLISQHWLRTFPSEMKKFWTGTFQAFFSFRRALLILWSVKVLFFRFGGSPDWWYWQPLGEWSGHWQVLSLLARRALTTLAVVAYF